MQTHIEVIVNQNSEEWTKNIEKFLARKDIITASQDFKQFSRGNELVFTALYVMRKEFIEYKRQEEEFKKMQESKTSQMSSESVEKVEKTKESELVEV